MPDFSLAVNGEESLDPNVVFLVSYPRDEDFSFYDKNRMSPPHFKKGRLKYLTV